MAKLCIKDLTLRGRRVFIRVDFNVPQDEKGAAGTAIPMAWKSRTPPSKAASDADEKKLLKDPDWVDEEEADLILAMREEKEHGLRGENIRDFARRHGRNLKG